MTTADQVTEKRRLQRARQLWRLCAGIEYALATQGYQATVADALKAAGMSRRSFYEWFTSLESVYKRMQSATELAMQRLLDGDESMGVDMAYSATLSLYPSDDTLLLAMGAPSICSFVRTAEIERAHNVACGIALGRAPRTREQHLTDEMLLQWADDVLASKAVQS